MPERFGLLSITTKSTFSFLPADSFGYFSLPTSCKMNFESLPL
ncbi:hypothetical protein CSB67_4267 [Enterobacter hormaechei]|nr:hypothetical protein CSB67_4267 [Enterobacter hormaechei]